MDDPTNEKPLSFWRGGFESCKFRTFVKIMNQSNRFLGDLFSSSLYDLKLGWKVDSRENWPSVPLRFINVHLKVPAVTTLQYISSRAW